MTDRTFAGVPVEGDLYDSYQERKDQADPKVLLDEIRNVLEHPRVDAVIWEQFTPHFNDGEPCVFSVNEAKLKLNNVEGVRYDDEYGENIVDDMSLYSYPVKSWEYPRRYIDGKFQRDTSGEKRPVYDFRGEKIFESPDLKDLYARLERLNDGLTGGQHEIELHKSFGDHAQVVATLDSFEVMEYDHY